MKSERNERFSRRGLIKLAAAAGLAGATLPPVAGSNAAGDSMPTGRKSIDELTDEQRRNAERMV